MAEEARQIRATIYGHVGGRATLRGDKLPQVSRRCDTTWITAGHPDNPDWLTGMVTITTLRRRHGMSPSVATDSDQILARSDTSTGTKIYAKQIQDEDAWSSPHTQPRCLNAHRFKSTRNPRKAIRRLRVRRLTSGRHQPPAHAAETSDTTPGATPTSTPRPNHDENPDLTHHQRYATIWTIRSPTRLHRSTTSSCVVLGHRVRSHRRARPRTRMSVCCVGGRRHRCRSHGDGCRAMATEPG
jgi:hypothetical protein